jgi:hypothetical protein
MFCPNPECPHFLETGNPAEYVDGVLECADCGAALVPEPPVAEEPVHELPVDDREHELERLTAITEPAFGALLRSVLDQAGIAYSARADGVQDMFAAGRVGTSYNVLTGPSWLYVERARIEEAREILAALEAEPEPLDEELAGDDEE